MLKINFRRVITDGKNYMPEIDGLRFLAIFTVIIYHIAILVSIKNNIPITNKLLMPFLTGGQGVQVFFIISGFILTLPFASKYPKGEKISLRDYFYRRLTRLEPPYIITLLLFFCIIIYIGKHSFFSLIDNLVASIFYVH